MNSPDEKKINPQVRKVTIGIREMKEISIFPLSIADQLKMSDLIAQGLKAFVDSGEQPDMAFVSNLVKLIQDNIEKLLGLVTDPTELGTDILSQLTNNQVVEIAELIFKENYQTIGKKVADLLVKVSPYLSGRSSPLSSDGINNSASRTSSEKAGEMVE